MTGPRSRTHWIVQVALDASHKAAEPSSLDPRASIDDIWSDAAKLSGLSDGELARHVATHCSLAVADLAQAESAAVKFIPEKLARASCVFPLRESDRSLVVASSDPRQLTVEEDLKFASGRAPLFEVAPPAALRRAIELHYRPDSGIEELLRHIESSGDGVHVIDDPGPDSASTANTNMGPVVRLANAVLQKAITERASDVHLEPGRAVGTVRYRIDGVLHLRMRVPMPVFLRLVSRIKIMGNIDISDRLRPSDGRARVQTQAGVHDLRISTVPTRNAEKAVIRILPTSSSQSLADLDLPAHELTRVHEMLSHRDHIVVVTGPTGSGKTTTLYAAVRELATGDVNVMTVEDPVEYEIEGITQIQVEPKRGVTFASALRAILRQDPDIILIGEIRDLETAEIAVQGAQTGHLVLATLHTNDAVGVVARLHDLGLDRSAIGESVRGIVAQRLVRRVCPDCTESIGREGPVGTTAQLAERYGVRPKVRAIGCVSCEGTGYRGRVPIVETVASTARFRELIVEDATSDALR